MLIKVISGGQTGIDQAALAAARDAGLKTGGWAPKGYRTLDGDNPVLCEFGLKEHESRNYPPRTQQNVKDSDGTLRLAVDFRSPGEVCTLKAIRAIGRPYLDINLRESVNACEIAKWIIETGIDILNVAGNSEETFPGIFEHAYPILVQVFIEASVL